MKQLILGVLTTVLIGVGPAAAVATLNANPETGEFVLSGGSAFGDLMVTGAFTDHSTAMSAAAGRDPRTVSLNATHAAVTTVTVNFRGLGTMVYELYDGATVPRGRLLSTTIPAGQCQELDGWPALVSMRNLHETLQKVDRSWERTPQARDWARVLADLTLFYMGSDFSTDCSAMARPQDHWGCDGPASPLTCSEWGACCDQHDKCYQENQCNSASWACFARAQSAYFAKKCDSGGGEVCHKCNVRVKECFEGPPPGKAECCQCRSKSGCPAGVKPCGTKRQDEVQIMF